MGSSEYRSFCPNSSRAELETESRNICRDTKEKKGFQRRKL